MAEYQDDNIFAKILRDELPATRVFEDDDTLVFKASILDGAVAKGVLSEDAFVAGNTAADATDRFIFDQSAGRLWFDADGSGAGGQLLVARFDQGAIVEADDILIV